MCRGLGHFYGKMQNVLESQDIQHMFSDVLEECLHKRVCS